MIATFLGVVPSPTPGKVRVAFVTSEEMSWWVEVSMPIVFPERLAQLLESMILLANDPAQAIEAGILTREDYEEALAARDKARAERGPDIQKVH